MAKIFGQELTKKEMLERLGNISSLAGITRLDRVGGRADGMHTYEVLNERMRFTVHADKAMDIGAMYYDGMPLFFLARPGQMNSLWYSDCENSPRSISCGMMFTCGFNNVGPLQNEANGRTLPQHGYLRNCPASLDGARCYWEGDDYFMELTGEMREAELFGENLVLRRKITSKLGEPSVRIQDEIENEGCEDAPLMLMYHCNAGYPLLDKNSRLVADIIETACRDKAAEDGLTAEELKAFGEPVTGYPEQVFYHQLSAHEGKCSAAMTNPDKRVALEITFDNKELPYLIHWKCRDAGNYVTGIEPSNCHPEGVHKERENGTLRILHPGEAAKTDLTFTVYSGESYDSRFGK